MALSRAGDVGELVQSFEAASGRRERANVLIALGRCGRPEAVAPLLAVLSDRDADNDARLFAAHALGELQATDAVDALIATLHDGAKKLRVASARSLGEIGDDRAVQALKRAASDDDDALRAYAVEALTGFWRHDDVIDVLIGALADKSRLVRREAAVGLVRSGSSRALAPLQEAAEREPWLSRGMMRRAAAALAAKQPRTGEGHERSGG